MKLKKHRIRKKRYRSTLLHRQPPSKVELDARRGAEIHGPFLTPAGNNTDLRLADEVADEVAIIQRSWNEDTMILRSQGITNIPIDSATESEVARRLRRNLTLVSIPYLHVFRCDYRRFAHRWFTRGGFTQDWPLHDEYDSVKNYPAP